MGHLPRERQSQLPDRLSTISDALAELEAGDLRRTAWLEPYEDITDRFLSFQRDYYRALVLIQLGRDADAAELAATLEAEEDSSAWDPSAPMPFSRCGLRLCYGPDADSRLWRRSAPCSLRSPMR